MCVRHEFYSFIMLTVEARVGVRVYCSSLLNSHSALAKVNTLEARSTIWQNIYKFYGHVCRVRNSLVPFSFQAQIIGRSNRMSTIKSMSKVFTNERKTPANGSVVHDNICHFHLKMRFVPVHRLANCEGHLAQNQRNCLLVHFYSIVFIWMPKQALLNGNELKCEQWVSTLHQRTRRSINSYAYNMHVRLYALCLCNTSSLTFIFKTLAHSIIYSDALER